MKEIEGKGVNDDSQLYSHQLICEFGSAFFKTLLDASRRGEEPLGDIEQDDGFMQVLVLLVTRVSQRGFSAERGPAIERELNRVCIHTDSPSELNGWS